jgi:2-polyprenyl-3-methyl-5-hydroxy-6-metoxy-1,4-benzoquinol methylase
MPTIEEQAAFYDEWNAHHRSGDVEAQDEESKARAAKVLEYVDRLQLSNPEILEIGCGTGWLTAKLSERGRCLGIDLSSRAIEIAKERGLSVEFKAGDFFEIALPKAHYDLAVVVETIAYVTDQPRFVAKLVSHLKPGGYLILTSMNKFVYERRHDVMQLKPGQVRHWLGRSELYQLLHPSFRVLRTTTVLPCGHKGILRIVNSPKLNGVLNWVFSRDLIRRGKEWLGLGQTRVLLAVRR